jgi:hypothetical protein
VSAICAEMGDMNSQGQGQWLSEDSDSVRVRGAVVASQHSNQTKREFIFGLP